MGKLISSKEAMKLLNISKPTIDKWCSEGKLPFYKPSGGKRYFDTDELDEWIRKGAA